MYVNTVNIPITILFHVLDTIGDKFFIILQGSVQVLVPHPEITEVKTLIEQSRKVMEEKEQALKEVNTKIH